MKYEEMVDLVAGVILDLRKENDADMTARAIMVHISDALKEPTVAQIEDWHLHFREYLNTGGVSELDLLKAAFSIAASPLYPEKE